MVLVLFLVATFIGGLVTGISGFAMGLVVSGIWLHVLTPVQTASLITGYALFVQGYGIWKLRRAFVWRKVAPLIIGGAFGVPVGTLLLNYTHPTLLRVGVGMLLALYSLYGLVKPVLKPVTAGTPADIGVGFLNGLLGGLTGLSGIVVVIWCQWQGLLKDAQRTIFQPVIFAAFVMNAMWLGISGAITGDIVKLFLLGLPALLAGTWLGMRLYGQLNETNFRKIVLILLLLSGVLLIVPFSIFNQ